MANDVSNSDVEHLRRLAGGDLQALGPLYGQHRGVVMTVLRGQRAPLAELEELCQEVFLTLAKVAHRFQPSASVRSFIVGIAVRLAKKARGVSWLHRTLLRRNASNNETHTVPQQRSDAAREAQRLLAALPEDWRTVVLLNLVEGWTAEEIATSLGMKPATVYTRLHRARARIHELAGGEP
jgi:RNA polymerase sigma-70 factor (ECF subfamily)